MHKGEYVLPQTMVDQRSGLPDMNKLGGQNITVNISMSGVMTSTPSDERAIATRMAQRLNEVLTSKGLKTIGV